MMNWGYGPGFNGMYGGGFWWMGLIGMALQALFWIALIVIGIYLFRRYNSRNSLGPSNESHAFEILRERFARGEIDSEEYQRRKHELSQK